MPNPIKALVYMFTLCCSALSFANTSEQLLQRITQSKSELTQQEAKVNQQTLALQQKINNELATVKKLREQVSAIQRVADEQILGLDQLQTRVNKWKEQDNYQKLLLQTYFEQQGISTQDFVDATGDIKFSSSLFASLQSHLIDNLAPQWQHTEVVNQQGEVNKFQVLEIGPISLAYNQSLQQGGLVEQQANQPLPSLINATYSQPQAIQLASLEQTGQAMVTFDPTLGNAIKLQNNQQGVISHIEKGGVWAFPILFFGALAFIVASIKSLQLLRLPKVHVDFIDRIKAADSMQSATALFSGPEKKLVEIANETNVSAQRDDQMVAFLMQYRHKVENYLGIIATSAAIAPLLGLLGTVSGMINTFMMMNTFGTGDAATVSGGISEALVTTELGLIVAIPSLIMSALLNRRAKSYNAKLEANAIQLSKLEV